MMHSETLIWMMSILCRTHKRRSSYEKLTVHAEDHPSTPPPPSGAPHSQSSTCYLHKAMPAGILLLKLSFREQYFCVEMYVCENTRLGIPVNKHVSAQSFFPSSSCNSHLCMLLKHEKNQQTFWLHYYHNYITNVNLEQKQYFCTWKLFCILIFFFLF